MKITLPLVAIGVLSTLFLFAGRPDPEDALVLADIDIAELADEQRLGRPRFAGLLEGGQALRFSAERAAPLADATDLFAAEDVSVRLTLAPGLEALIDAGGALVDMSGQTAQLSGGVIIRRTDGLRLETAQLTMGLSELRAQSDGQVVVEGPGLTLEAGAMQINQAEQMHFTEWVRVVYDPASVEE
ncbi:MAG: LPS export ABC transporter periplasmic protein LptC [Pseudomonadota bacterium]